jgi:hypothetical protein
VEVKPQVGHVYFSSTAPERDTIKLPKFNGSMSWIPFHCQFKVAVKHKWADNEKAIDLLAISALHIIPTNVRYEDSMATLGSPTGRDISFPAKNKD